MAHTDPYRLAPSDGAERTPDGAGPDVLRAVLWVVLVVSMVGNTVVSYTGAGVGVHLAFGLVTLACATTLLVRHLRSRR